MSKALNDLRPEFRPYVFEFLARCVESDLPEIEIVGTLRDKTEQLHFLAIGTSRRKDSLHLHGLAIDVGIKELMKMKNWAPDHPNWEKLGKIGESVGLRWGGRWPSFPDKPHFECPLMMEEEFYQGLTTLV